jgi:hypothetical protein
MFIQPSPRLQLTSLYLVSSFTLSELTGGVLHLCNGLQATPVGFTGAAVLLADGTESDLVYHKNSDGGAAFDLPEGGHIYVSNSEIGSYPDDLSGGVYALTFDGTNKAVGYKQLLSGTAYNCHGGETPWGSWISCEEYRDNGRCWQGELYRMKCFFLSWITTLSMYII